MMFKRKIYEQMLNWKNKQTKTALLVKGARRVGKSTVVEEFAKSEYKSYVLIDFSNVSKEINELFDDLSDLDYFFAQIQYLTHSILYRGESVVIFDEVQLNPKARQAIKHLVKDGRYDYIETGSLLSIKKNVEGILIPSEETHLKMFPMDFEEFCWALGDQTTPNLIRNSVQSSVAFGEAVHRKLMRLFRLYMILGGMPQAIDTYIKTSNLLEVDAVKKMIINLYDEDFRKIDKSGMSSLIFREIPAQLNSNIGRYKISSVNRDARASRIIEKIFDMKDSQVVDVAHAITDPNVGLALSVDMDRFKLYTADTGIFTSLAFIAESNNGDDIYKRLLSDKSSANLGYLFENMVAQILSTSNQELYFYTEYNKESKHSYEVDFILADNNKIIPIEVKSSSNSSSHKSLDAFIQKFSNRINRAYVVHTKDIKQEGIIKYIPLYAMPFIFENTNSFM